MKKRLSVMLAAALCTMALTFSAYAGELINADQARAIAQKQVPAGSTHLVTLNELHKMYPYYEVKFYDSATNTEYEIEVYQNGGAIKKYEMDSKIAYGSSQIRLSSADIQNIVTREYPGAIFHKIELDRDNGLYEYEVEFHAPGMRGDMTINPETGAIMDKEIKYAFRG